MGSGIHQRLDRELAFHPLQIYPQSLMLQPRKPSLPTGA
jgi:hypothetical protein